MIAAPQKGEATSPTVFLQRVHSTVPSKPVNQSFMPNIGAV
jgi:hypothetical protein